MLLINDIENSDLDAPDAFTEAEKRSAAESQQPYGGNDNHGENTENKEKPVISWDLYEKFSSEFLDKHHDLVLYDIFHRIKAFILFPLNCPCDKPCQCSQWREKIVLTLSTHQYTEAQRFENAERLAAMKALYQIPEDHSFRALHTQAYPLWLIEKEWQKKEEKNHFKMIDQLVWALLQLGKAYMVCFLPPEVGLAEAIKMILGGLPVGAKSANSTKTVRFGGEKKYDELFKRYQSVCHFIAAFEYCKRETLHGERLFMSSPYPSLDLIERFLSVAHWFRKSLLFLVRPNFKNKIFLTEKDLCSLPPWIQSKGLHIPIEPFKRRLKEIVLSAEYIDPANPDATKRGLECFSETFLKKYLPEEI